MCQSNDESKIITASKDCGILEWKVNKTDKYIAGLRTHKDSVNSVCYSPDDKYYVSGSLDGTIRIWQSGYSLKEKKKIDNLSGVLVQGTDMRNLHPDSLISSKRKRWLKQYGAKVK